MPDKTVRIDGHFNILYNGVITDPEALGRGVVQGVKEYRHKNVDDFLKNGYPDLSKLPGKLLVELTGVTDVNTQVELVLHAVLFAIGLCPRVKIADAQSISAPEKIQTEDKSLLPKSFKSIDLHSEKIIDASPEQDRGRDVISVDTLEEAGPAKTEEKAKRYMYVPQNREFSAHTPALIYQGQGPVRDFFPISASFIIKGSIHLTGRKLRIFATGKPL